MGFLGRVPFSVDDYPGYNCQNVERDSQVKDTGGCTYVFGFSFEGSLWKQLGVKILSKEDLNEGKKERWVERWKRDDPNQPKNRKEPHQIGSACNEIKMTDGCRI